jgi:tetratricopeptide (TPR) repeat protein
MNRPNEIENALQLLQQGSFKRALKSALSATKKPSEAAVAFNIAGIATSSMGRPKDAIVHFQKAIKLKPGFLDAQENLAQTLIIVQRADAALTVLIRLTKKAPTDWKVWQLKAQAELVLGQGKAALQSANTALSLTTNGTAVYRLRSTIYLGLGRTKDAIADLESILQINPHDVKALTELSLPLARQTQTQAALDVVYKAVELAPNDVPARFRLASQFVEMGETAKGIAQYQAVLEIERDHPASLKRLALILDKEKAAAFEPRIRAALNKVAKKSEDRASLFFALAAALDARGNVTESQKMLGLANKEMANLLPYDGDADAEIMNKILGRFETKFDSASSHPTNCNPIFVIGLPRSGTTLVEAVLGQHPNVFPLGEQANLGAILHETIEDDLPLTPQIITEMAQEDLRRLPDFPEGTIAYVDKLPENYRLVGFIKTIYPNARFINVRRDPRDIALSMWKAHFSGTELSYSYSWERMAFRFNLYARTMAHWHKVLADQILDVHYEVLVGDIEETSKRIANFCDLEWHPEMAHPNRSKAQVLTLSATQLRRPVHRASVGKWKNQNALLDPFVQGLDRDLWRNYLCESTTP